MESTLEIAHDMFVGLGASRLIDLFLQLEESEEEVPSELRRLISAALEKRCKNTLEILEPKEIKDDE